MGNAEMPLTEHLVDLRKSILISVVVVGIAFVVLFNYSEIIFKALTFPLNSEIRIDGKSPYVHTIPKAPTSLVFLSPAEAFWMHLKVSFVAALLVSLPAIFYELWRFVSPGLLAREKKYVLPFILSATGLFLIGAAFCFLIVLPFAMTFLLGYKTANLAPMISVGNYIDFCLKFILAFGAIFELPLVIIFLTRFGIVTTKTLAKNRKYAVLFAFILAAVLTPTPDAFNQTLMAVPIIILYELGILMSRIFVRKKRGG
jgi:sec-independent protein translocase protein TatC